MIYTFEQPVLLFTDLSAPAEIASVNEAYAFLTEWPQARRDSAYHIAFNACKAALSEAIDAETARSTIVAFAKRHGIFAPDISGIIAAGATGSLTEIRN